jgi:hypothetical protein
LLLAACADDPDDPQMMMMGDPSIEGTPVSSFEASSCSTGTVLALSIQIAEEVDCMMPGQLVKFEELHGIARRRRQGAARARRRRARQRGGTAQAEHDGLRRDRER